MNKLDILKELGEMEGFYEALVKKNPGREQDARVEALDWAITCVSKAPDPESTLTSEEPEEEYYRDPGCQNPDREYYCGEICLQCNRCGRFDKDMDPAWRMHTEDRSR